MAKDNKSTFASIIGTNSSTMLAVAVMLILGIMLLPMPTFLIDMFLVMNITGALVIIFVARLHYAITSTCLLYTSPSPRDS